MINPRFYFSLKFCYAVNKEKDFERVDTDGCFFILSYRKVVGATIKIIHNSD